MQAAAASGLADIVMVSDTAAACIEEAIKLVPQVASAQSFEAALAADVDAVVIATPSALHMEQSVAAFEKGKAVFCQKPLGRNAQEVSAVVAAAHKANRLLGADFSYRYTAAFRAILPIIQ